MVSIPFSRASLYLPSYFATEIFSVCLFLQLEIYVFKVFSSSLMPWQDKLVCFSRLEYFQPSLAFMGERECDFWKEIFNDEN